MSLTAEQQADLKQQLQTRRAELQALVRDELAGAGHEHLAGQVHDRGEESFADLLADTDLAILTLDIQELYEIDAALERVNGGHYGVCIDCGVDIPLARLQSRPAAIRCVECQERAE